MFFRPASFLETELTADDVSLRKTSADVSVHEYFALSLYLLPVSMADTLFMMGAVSFSRALSRSLAGVDIAADLEP